MLFYLRNLRACPNAIVTSAPLNGKTEGKNRGKKNTHYVTGNILRGKRRRNRRSYQYTYFCRGLPKVWPSSLNHSGGDQTFTKRLRFGRPIHAQVPLADSVSRILDTQSAHFRACNVSLGSHLAPGNWGRALREQSTGPSEWSLFVLPFQSVLFWYWRPHHFCTFSYSKNCTKENRGEVGTT